MDSFPDWFIHPASFGEKENGAAPARGPDVGLEVN
jgi:hypothetical protein